MVTDFELADRGSILHTCINSTTFGAPLPATLDGPEAYRFRVDIFTGLEGHLSDQVSLTMAYRGYFQYHQGELSLKIIW